MTSFAKNAYNKDNYGGYKGWEAAGRPEYTDEMLKPYMGTVPGRSDTSVGGISAVNPQAGQANELDAFKRYEDAAFNSASSRLNPFFEQQNAQFGQQMANQGLPVGSDAYNSSFGQLRQGQNDAMSKAAFDAMGFGLGAQNQSFQQDLSRSQLANSLLQAKMANQLGYAGLNQNNSQFNKSLAFGRDQFYDTLNQRNYEFDSNQDFNYWDRGNQFDIANAGLDQGNMFGSWDRQFRDSSWDDQIMMSLFGGGAPNPYGIDPNSAYNQQVGSATGVRGQNFGFMGGLLGF